MAEFGSGRFLTTLAVQPSASTCPCTKANGKKARQRPPIFILPSDWPGRFYYSIQVKALCNELTTIYCQKYVYSDVKKPYHGAPSK